MKRALLPLLAAASLTLTACGSDEEPAPTPAPETSSPQAEAPQELPPEGPPPEEPPPEEFPPEVPMGGEPPAIDPAPMPDNGVPPEEPGPGPEGCAPEYPFAPYGCNESGLPIVPEGTHIDERCAIMFGGECSTAERDAYRALWDRYGYDEFGNEIGG